MGDSFYKLGGIYSISHVKSGRSYIGSAVLFFKRWSEHRMNLRRNKHPNKRLQNFWNKYGEDAFTFEIIEAIENPTKELLETREQYWIDCYKSADREIGFNIRGIAKSNLGLRLDKSKVTKQEILEFCKLNGYRPCATSKNKFESRLGHTVWIYTDSSYVGYDSNFTDEYLKYPTYQKWYKKNLQTKILDFISINNRLPCRISNNKLERSLAASLRHFRNKNKISYDKKFCKILYEILSTNNVKHKQGVYSNF
jgi:group I intron endonuclease